MLLRLLAGGLASWAFLFAAGLAFIQACGGGGGVFAVAVAVAGRPAFQGWGSCVVWCVSAELWSAQLCVLVLRGNFSQWQPLICLCRVLRTQRLATANPCLTACVCVQLSNVPVCACVQWGE